MTASGTVRIVGLILALSLAGPVAAQVAPATSPDPVAVLDAMLADQSATLDAAPATAPMPAADSAAQPDIISGVVVQAPPVHKLPPTADEYSWAWNGGGYSIHFGLNPTICIMDGSVCGTATLAHILWRRSGRDVQVIIPRSENWSPDGPEKGDAQACARGADAFAARPAASPTGSTGGVTPTPAQEAAAARASFAASLATAAALKACSFNPRLPEEWILTGKLSEDERAMKVDLTCTSCSLERLKDHFQPILFSRWGDADPPGPPLPPLVADETRISIQAGRGLLAGTYRDPPGAAAGPAVLLLPGTGPINSDGDSMLSGPGPSNLRLIAEALDKAGYRSLRYDKRGIGDSSRGVIPSTGLKVTDLVSDAADWARYLAGQPNVTCVVLLGHSEGAMVAMLAAQKIKVCGLVSLSGPGRPLGDTLRTQVEHADLTKAVKAQFVPILASLKAGKPVASIPEALSGLEPDAQPFLMSKINLDPASLIQAVKAPVLIIQGDNDLQVPVEDAQRLAAAKPDAQLLIVKNMNNATKSAPGMDDANIARGLELNAPLAKPVMPAVIAFLERVGP